MAGEDPALGSRVGGAAERPRCHSAAMTKPTALLAQWAMQLATTCPLTIRRLASAAPPTAVVATAAAVGQPSPPRTSLSRNVASAGPTCHRPNAALEPTSATRGPPAWWSNANSTPRKATSSNAAVPIGMRTSVCHASSRGVSSARRSDRTRWPNSRCPATAAHSATVPVITRAPTLPQRHPDLRSPGASPSWPHVNPRRRASCTSSAPATTLRVT